jgi:hypothetical protein
MTETMSPFTPPGTEVIYAYPNNGYDWDQKRAVENLVLGGVYVVERTEVHQSSTDVYLKSPPNIRFNSVMFAPRVS